MRLVAIAALLLSLAAQSPANEGLDPKNTYGVIVGVLSWQQGSLTTYATDNRQDVALYKQLQALGGSPNSI